jgi:hypothetical protein
MASIPQRSQELNYYDDSSSNESSTITITLIVIFAILLVFFTMKIKTCKASFQSDPIKVSTWSGLPEELDSIETRLKSYKAPENDAPASMTAIRHLSEQEYGKF